MTKMLYPFLQLLGLKGVIGVIGLMTFLLVYKHSVKIFDWIENNTYGTRNYVVDKFDYLFIKVNPTHVTYVLLFLSFGNGMLVLIICGFFSWWLWGILLALIISFIGWKIPKPFMNYLVKRRIDAYSSQMVDGLTLLANGIRAGLSVPQSIGMVVDELPIPISQEFNLILQQNKIGVPLEECFENLAKRVPTEDNDMFVSSVNILRETGGNLSEVFDTIVSVIRERIRLKQKIDSATAQGKFQGLTIFCMPWVVLSLYFISDPSTVIRIFTEPLGIIALIVALILDCIGGYFILKIVDIKV
ncbi:MAG: hypothetical protein A2381_14220 [Bdellovibrionales bacterium RIFOXYB1_FULL_37_110]|nr:MAG: hypothetical protein A2181_05455 [Bdellovibrionales bacterium RIFOXYA1_FULL_38_20]OFZ47819.1 MAG: hypothetical protein A2417_15215 [Bdellovibrionales bacterium RIFOXYC1_FULL_37_79]OFZ57566.1 MAG: hypothetical protein A2381_14220 [Bdellovibrionales bacterium RIFOXYB1_FULL_37_110]OFZ61634.1 MAG: hypothetical protein A2577_10620 [Bdellovibrionales bacterium RIFOXYD1_FULL_36_51]